MTASSIFKRTLLAAAIGLPLAGVALAQSQSIRTVQAVPDAVYTYHGAIMAPPPESELAPVAARSVTNTEITVQQPGPSVAYPDGSLDEPVALDSEATHSHEAALVTTKQVYDRNGNLIKTTQVDHAREMGDMQ